MFIAETKLRLIFLLRSKKDFVILLGVLIESWPLKHKNVDVDQNSPAGLNFANEDEASDFAAAVSAKLHERKQRRDGKWRLFVQVSFYKEEDES